MHHAAASHEAGESVIKSLVDKGAFLSLTTRKGETAFDIAVRHGRDESVVNALKLPVNVTDNKDVIGRMETALHKIIQERCQFLLDEHGIQLPQISIMWEASEDPSLWFPVPGMYGGFRLEFEGEDLVSLSWIRICGGSEMRHVIHRDGTVTNESEKVAGTFT